MKGVHYAKRDKEWVASHPAFGTRYFKNKNEAISQRKEWLEKANLKKPSPRKDFSGYENDYWKVIGDAGINSKTKPDSQLVVARNKITDQVTTKSIWEIKSGGVTGTNGVNLAGGIDKKGNKWRLRMTFSKQTLTVGYFDSAQQALEYKKGAYKKYLEKGLIPSKYHKPTITHHKYIAMNRKNYCFSIRNRKYRISKTFSTLPDALAYRNQWLTDHNLPIPD